MNFFKFFIIALFFIIVTGCESKSVNEPPTLYQPSFETKAGTATAGIAFIIKHKKAHYAVSAQHLIGQAGGLDKNYKGKDLKNIFKRVTLTPINTEYSKLISNSYIDIPLAEGASEKTAKNDLFISHIESNLSSHTVKIAKRFAKPGSKVKLYAKVLNSTDTIHPAIVIKSTGDHLIYTFDNHIELRATSGAPILNQNNEVVGIHLGGKTSKYGPTVGFANPAKSILKYLPK